MKHTINAEYGAGPAGGMFERLLESQRRKLLDAFTEFRRNDPDGSVLNVGLPGALLPDAASPLAGATDQQTRSRVTFFKLPAPDAGTSRRPTLAESWTRQLDNPHLPFADGEFDWVFCGEVIEHAGNFERQFQLLMELNRVARKGVFVTTPNRRHPIEFHTGIPFFHWLPQAWWRRMLAWTGKPLSAASLNLLDSGALYKLASLLPAKPKHDVGHKRVFGIKAHFFLMIEKHAASATPGVDAGEAARKADKP
ncbi:MAG TPA: methyltransferase domain-containing protein [Noviherbaspirillum sp.]|uniref:methyltransferase domain-containing protein n=1 Tax=Noviherbaspirillum sp. TaxID=1926288 RepID=UPI002DDD381A|nr:methyltransferase domain-containing protein [Noviherbaspirillum sp.]HEV2610339.1 methyltransferase domain-containing protein [Noviherbaspirillum sp.]